MQKRWVRLESFSVYQRQSFLRWQSSESYCKVVAIPKEAKRKNNFPHKINYILKEFCEPIARSWSEIMMEFLTRSCLHRRTKKGRWKKEANKTNLTSHHQTLLPSSVLANGVVSRNDALIIIACVVKQDSPALTFPFLRLSWKRGIAHQLTRRKQTVWWRRLHNMQKILDDFNFE